MNPTPWPCRRWRGRSSSRGGCDLPPSYASDFCLARYSTVDGSLDTALDTDGSVTTDFALGADPSENFDTVKGVVIQTADDKMVTAGTCADYLVGVWRFCLARYNTNGTLDGTFGGTGKLTTSIGGLNDDEAAAAALQTDGKIVVAGTCKTASGGFDFCLVRYNTNGSLDTSFGAGGKVSTDFGSGNFANALALKDGKIVVAGKCSGSFCLAQYNESDGSLDTLFGVGGKVTTPIGTFDEAHAVAIQTDGKIVAAGFCYGSTNYHFCLARYNADGSLDPTFGIGGKVISPISTQDVAQALAIQTDGNIVVAGRCGSSSCVARYLGAGTDQAPTDITLSSSAIPENSVVGTAIGNFSTTDPDAGDTFTYSLVAGPGVGDNASFTIAGSILKANAVFDFETKSSYSIRVQTTDAGGRSFEKALTISVTDVNEAPVAVNDSAVTSKGNFVDIDVLANDSDPDGDTLTVVAVTQPSKGIAQIKGGVVTYTPRNNYTGPDSFTYTISDVKGLTAIATVSINVITGNAPPRAVRDNVATLVDTAVIISVLANDSDPDGDTLAVVAVTQGANGAAVIDASGTVTYMPATLDLKCTAVHK